MKFTEAQLEAAIIELLEGQGYPKFLERVDLDDLDNNQIYMN